jgi:hypothetical protein
MHNDEKRTPQKRKTASDGLIEKGTKIVRFDNTNRTPPPSLIRPGSPHFNSGHEPKSLQKGSRPEKS